MDNNFNHFATAIGIQFNPEPMEIDCNNGVFYNIPTQSQEISEPEPMDFEESGYDMDSIEPMDVDEENPNDFLPEALAVRQTMIDCGPEESTILSEDELDTGFDEETSDSDFEYYEETGEAENSEDDSDWEYELVEE